MVDFLVGFSSPSIVQNFVEDARSGQTQNKQTRKHLRLIKYMRFAVPLLAHRGQHDRRLCNLQRENSLKVKCDILLLWRTSC